MKYELRRLGDPVQYATAIAPYVSDVLNFIFPCPSVYSVATSNVSVLSVYSVAKNNMSVYSVAK